MSISTSGVDTGKTVDLDALRRAVQKEEDEEQKLQEELTDSLSGENETDENQDEVNLDTFETQQADSNEPADETANETSKQEVSDNNESANVEETAAETDAEEKSSDDDVKEILLRDDLTAAQKLALLAGIVTGKVAGIFNKDKDDKEESEEDAAVDETITEEKAEETTAHEMIEEEASDEETTDEEVLEVEENETAKAGADNSPAKDDKPFGDTIGFPADVNDLADLNVEECSDEIGHATTPEDNNQVKDWLNGWRDTLNDENEIGLLTDEQLELLNEAIDEVEQAIEDIAKVVEDKTNEVNSENVQAVKEMAPVDVEVDDDELVGLTVEDALEVIAEAVETQMYERHVYSTRVSKNLDKASIKDNITAVSEFMKSYNETYEQTCAFNAEFLSLTDESNFKNAELIAKRLKNNQYIITKELKKATAAVESVQISKVNPNDKIENKYNDKGLHVLSKLQRLITLDDTAEENSEDAILTKDEYMELQQDFIDAQDKTVAYTILLNESKKYGIMQSEATA